MTNIPGTNIRIGWDGRPFATLECASDGCPRHVSARPFRSRDTTAHELLDFALELAAEDGWDLATPYLPFCPDHRQD